MTDLVGSGGFAAIPTTALRRVFNAAGHDREFRVANVTLAAHWTRRRALRTQHAPPRAGLRLHLLHCSNYRFLFFAKITFQLSL